MRFSEEIIAPITGTISALDELPVEIYKSSPDDVSDLKKYRNSKKIFAVLVQAAVTVNYKFLF